MEKSEKVLLISSIILVGFVMGVFYHYILGYYLHQPHPFNTFLANPLQYFCDFRELLANISDFAPYKVPTPWINYLPLSYILLFPFTLIANKLLAYLTFLSGFMAFFIYANIKSFYSQNLSKLQNFQSIFIISFLSYPILYLIDRGNFDMFLLVIFALFVYTFKQEKYLLSAFLLAILNAIKPFWIPFLILFFTRKRPKEIIFNLILTFIFVVGGFMLLKGNFFNQISVLATTLTGFKKAYLYEVNGFYNLNYGCSLFSALNFIFCHFLGHVQPALFDRIYNIFSVIMTSLILFFVCKEKSYWKQITLLTVNMLLLPFTTTYYKLAFLFIPMWLFFNVKEKSKFDFLYTILFGLMLVPKNIIIVNMNAMRHVLIASGFNGWFLFSLGIILNPIIMLLLTGLVIFEQLYKKQEKINKLI